MGNKLPTLLGYRYSQLIWVFGQLLREQWLKESDLTGLAADKWQAIRSFATPRNG